jgi:hypothetical protein
MLISGECVKDLLDDKIDETQIYSDCPSVSAAFGLPRRLFFSGSGLNSKC